MTEIIKALEEWQDSMIPWLAAMDDPIVAKLEAWQAAMIPYLASLDNPPTPTGKLPLHRFGVHLIQSREADLKYIEALKPAAVKILDPDPNVVRRVLAALDPAGVCILRDHPLSEQKADMAADPTGTGKRHAADWIAKLTTGRFAEFGRDKRIVVCGINEPDVHNQAEEQIVFLYTKAFLEGLTAGGIRGLALNLSVGWPRNSGPDTPPVWDTFMPLEPIILRGNHFLCTHEYFYPTPQSSWGWYGNRIASCKMKVPIIIGEVGYTKQLISPPVGQPWGWIGNISAPQYAEMLWWYHDNVGGDASNPGSNIFAILPFTTGFASQDWASKDTQPAHADILARKRAYNWPVVWPVDRSGAVPPDEEEEPMLIVFPRFTGRITGYYGSVYKNASGGSYGHEGLDLSFTIGNSVFAAADGVVAYSGTDSLYGEYIRTYHPKLRACFFYAHLSERLVQNGNSIKQGQPIAKTGNSGNSSGPHLHFSVRQMDENGHYMQGRSVNSNATLDPLAWLAGWLSAGNLVEER